MASKPSNKPPVMAVSLAVLALIAALFAADFALANAERNELQDQAQVLFQQGQALQKQGKPEQALEFFRQAHALERQNPEYQLALVDTLLTTRKLDQASDLLHDLLQSNPHGGEANLMMARLLVKESKTDDAESNYHRAIYGSWGNDATSHRLQARLELVDLLASRGNRADLLAELLPLENEGIDPATRMKIARLYLAAGSPARAAAVYRSLLRSNPNDPRTLTGFGQTELALGDYRAAMNAFVNAYRANPADVAARGNIELSSAVTALDPTPRRLSSAEKFSRSNRVLDLARSAMQRCAVGHGLATSDDLGRADVLLAQKPAAVTNETSEERLGLAEQLWKDRLTSCGSAVTAQERPLQLIMEKLSR
jgi:tetratricopeptide (TPR) repeat protein